MKMLVYQITEISARFQTFQNLFTTSILSEMTFAFVSLG